MTTVALNGNTTGGNSTGSENMDSSVFLDMLNQNKSVLLTPAIIYTIVLMTIGIIGNPIAIFIYGFRWPITTTKYFLFCLAVLDLINCLITMPTEVAIMMNFYYFDNTAICKISRFTTYTMNNASVFILLVIAIDRYIRICRPHNQPISVKGSKITCGVGLLVGVGVSWPSLILYGRFVIPFQTANGNPVYGVMCQVENKYKVTPYPLAFIIYLWVAFCIIAIVMAVLYILIGREIIKRKRMKKMRTASTSSQVKKIRGESASTFSNNSVPTTAVSPPSTLSPVSPDIPSEQTCSATTLLRGRLPTLTSLKLSKSKLRPGKSTLMLFAITVVYILSFLPFLIVGIIRLMTGDSFYPSLSKTEQVAVNIFLRSYLVNNCANPIVYGLCNSQFRKECASLFRRKKRNSGL